MPTGFQGDTYLFFTRCLFVHFFSFTGFSLKKQQKTSKFLPLHYTVSTYYLLSLFGNNSSPGNY
ncbi:hypothetical protein PRABACTJOHN_00219 [Parabacteroides johnsonii DSM 18315]|uniref:Uncharacterized protein n=1 Tax=Parabacteroides johnsonii DSM 18315 TaxID=537006 RepID=B7B5B1_9BACT|nr:hypothetical protein PRABACTJOHN_00219 [Parabacteroides johnsonii DSM 18315]